MTAVDNDIVQPDENNNVIISARWKHQIFDRILFANQMMAPNIQKNVSIRPVMARKVKKNVIIQPNNTTFLRHSPEHLVLSSGWIITMFWTFRFITWVLTIQYRLHWLDPHYNTHSLNVVIMFNVKKSFSKLHSGLAKNMQKNTQKKYMVTYGSQSNRHWSEIEIKEKSLL
jgi:hypothetical protein